MPSRTADTEPFDLLPGRIIGGKYQIDRLLGAGYEGEVYRVAERPSGAIRALKLFYPERNENDKTSTFYARKLENLSGCGVVVKYHHTEHVRIAGSRVAALISECAEGEILENLIKRSRGKRLPEHEALSIFHQLAAGLTQIHAKGEYHGDIHDNNVLVHRRGVLFDVRIFDFYDYGKPTAQRRREDVIDCVRLFYDMLGGKPRYKSVRPEFKRIICGMRHSLILKRYPTAARLLNHLETFEWEEA